MEMLLIVVVLVLLLGGGGSGVAAKVIGERARRCLKHEMRSTVSSQPGNRAGLFS